MSYAHLTGDLDANPTLLERLDALAAQLSKIFNVTSGARTRAEQQTLYDNRASNPYPVAAPGTSRHETGNAADVTVDGQPIQTAIDAKTLKGAGLSPLAGDAVHVELAPNSPGLLSKIGGTLPVVGPLISPAGQAVGGAVAGAAGDVAGDAATATAKAVGDLVVGAIGKDGARVAISVGLVAAALALIGFGAARMLGLGQKLKLGASVAAKATPAGKVAGATT